MSERPLKPYSYQVEAVKRFLEIKRLLIADDMGMGKTAEAILARKALELKGYNPKTLIVSPGSVAHHWEDEIKSWYNGNQPSITRVQTSSFDYDIELAKKSDIVIVTYPTLSYFGHDRGKIEKLMRLGFRYGIVDEAHNAKNPESFRSGAVRELMHEAEYLNILTGTPIPNTIVDIYVLLNLLDKENFPLHDESSKAIVRNFFSAFKRNPSFVQQALEARMVRREPGDYFVDKKFPELRLNNFKIDLTDEHGEVYHSVYESDMFRPAQKLLELRLAALDPNLVSPDFLDVDLVTRLGKMESCVYSALDGLIDKIAQESGKALVFTDFKTGVMDKLERRYSKYHALIINGDIESQAEQGKISPREQIRRRFQKDPNNKVLFATTVMDEGVDLSAATDVIHLTMPYSPATLDQRNRRSQRINAEVDKDYVNAWIMKPILENNIPTIAEGIERLLEDKRSIIRCVMGKEARAQPITLEDLFEVNTNGSPTESRNLVPFMSPSQTLFSHFVNLRGMGSEEIGKFIHKRPEEARYIAELYANHWEGYYGGNTANVYLKVIRTLESFRKLQKKVDLASGPFSLSRRIKEPVDNIDINPYMLEAGRILEQQGKIVSGNESFEGAMHKLPFDRKTYDLAVCSLAMHMTKPKLERDGKIILERELVIREANRILKDGGYYIVTLPLSRNHPIMINEDLPIFFEGFNRLGFEVTPCSGFYTGPSKSNYRTFLGLMRKVGEPQKSELPEGMLSWKMDKHLSRKTARSTKERKGCVPEPREFTNEIIMEFLNSNTRKTLEESVFEVVK